MIRTATLTTPVVLRRPTAAAAGLQCSHVGIEIHGTWNIPAQSTQSPQTDLVHLAVTAVRCSRSFNIARNYLGLCGRGRSAMLIKSLPSAIRPPGEMTDYFFEALSHLGAFRWLCLHINIPPRFSTVYCRLPCRLPPTSYPMLLARISSEAQNRF